jgi:hypothetical protein
VIIVPSAEPEFGSAGVAGSSGQNPLGQQPLDEPELCIEKLVL